MAPPRNGWTYEHRSFLVVDAEDSSALLDPDLMGLRATLYRVVDEAFARSSINAQRWDREDRGDGILMLIEPAVPKVDLVDPLLDHLVAGLAELNQRDSLHKWLRLRVALHFGEVERDENGWGSEALTLTFRLAEAAAVKATLAAAARAQCVVVVSNDFYQAVIRHRHRSIDPGAYRPVAVPLKGRPTGVRAWVRVPGYPVPPGAAEPLEEPAEIPPAGSVDTTDPAAGPRGMVIRAGTVKAMFNDTVNVDGNFIIG